MNNIMQRVERFAKVFETPHGQLLVTIDWDDDAEIDVINVRGASRHGVMPELKASGWEDAATGARITFDAFDQEAAERHAKGFADMLDRFVTEDSSDAA